MKWSKLKAIAECHLAESLSGKLSYFMTRYGDRDSYTMARAWITYNHIEVASFSEVYWMGKHQGLTSRIVAYLQHDESIPPQTDQSLWKDARREAESILVDEGIFSTEQFIHALYSFINLSIAESITNRDALIRVLAVVDKRVGQRRLQQFVAQPDQSIFVQQMLAIRCRAENIR
jgi:hypothetical protein